MNPALPNLLLVDDDDTFREVLARALEKRGFEVIAFADAETALASIDGDLPELAVVDLKLPGASGLVLVERLHRLDPHTRIIVLTGYASVATAVEAIKLGATHYLAKPVNADEVVAALFRAPEGDPTTPIVVRPMSVDRLEWEHIQRVLVEHVGNVSATARALGMHRRTLQRKLMKKPVKE